VSARAGQRGEDLACACLARAGLSIVARNFRCRLGEIDIVARDGPVTVFVEVKERTSDSHGRGFEAVTAGKRRRLARAAQLYASAHGLSESPLRFDVVEVRWHAGEAQIRHERDAFGLEG
jgi:putative endonuclease